MVSRIRIERRPAYLIEGDTEIDVHQLSRGFVNEDVGDMTIAKAEDVPNDRGRGGASRIVESSTEPRHRFLMTLVEEVVHDRMTMATNLFECKELILAFNVRRRSTSRSLFQHGLHLGVDVVSGIVPAMRLVIRGEWKAVCARPCLGCALINQS